MEVAPLAGATSQRLRRTRVPDPGPDSTSNPPGSTSEQETDPLLPRFNSLVGSRGYVSHPIVPSQAGGDADSEGAPGSESDDDADGTLLLWLFRG